MPVIPGDVVQSGFGNSGYFWYTSSPPAGSNTYGTTARQIRIIKGSRGGVDIRSITGFLAWSTVDFANIVSGIMLVSIVEVIRTSSQVSSLPAVISYTNPQSTLPVIQYPSGFDSLWAGFITSPAVSDTAPTPVSPDIRITPMGCGPPAANHFRFDPGVLYADQDHQLFVAMYAPINYGTLQTVFQTPSNERMLSINGIDYGQTKESFASLNNVRSLPRDAMIGQ